MSEEFRTNERERRLGRKIGWGIFTAGVLLAVIFSIWPAGAGFTLIAAGVAFFGLAIALMSGRSYAARITDEGLCFRAFKPASPDHSLWQITIPWKEMVELRRYSPDPNGHHDNQEAALFVLTDQLVLIDNAYPGFFTADFAPYWLEAFAVAKGKGIKTARLFTETGAPHALPAGLPVFQLQQYGKPADWTNLLAMKLATKEKPAQPSPGE